MTVFWIIGITALVVIWVMTIVDLFRHHQSGAATAGWLALIVLVPFIGAVVYWAKKKPSGDEVEQAVPRRSRSAAKAGQLGPSTSTGS